MLLDDDQIELTAVVSLILFLFGVQAAAPKYILTELGWFYMLLSLAGLSVAVESQWRHEQGAE